MVVMTSRTVRYKMKLLEDGRVEVTEEEVTYERYNCCLTVLSTLCVCIRCGAIYM